MTDTDTTKELPTIAPESQDELPAEFLQKLKANKRKRRIRTAVVAAVAIAVVAAAVFAFTTLGKTDEQKAEKTGTYTQQVTKGDLDMTIEASGTLSANSTTSVYAEVAGTVSEVAVAEGDSVKEGDTLFTLTSEELTDAVEEKYDAMVDAYTAYKQAKESSSSSSSNSSSDSSQKSGSSASATSSSAKKSSSKSSSSESSSANKNASSSSSSSSSKSSEGETSGSKSASSENTSTDSSSEVNAQSVAQETSALRAGAGSTLMQATYTLGTTTTATVAAESGGSGTSATQAYSAYKQAKGAYEDALEDLEKLTVTATSNGTVSELSIAVGDAVNADSTTAALVISDTDKMTMTVQVSEYDIANIKKGQKATVTVKAADETVNAKVKSVSTTASSSGGTSGSNSGSSSSTTYYDVVLVIKKPTSSMLSGMNATAEITYESYEDALLVPTAAVSTDPQGNSYVTVQNGQDQTSRVSVTVLGNTDEAAAIEGELEEGQSVVVTYQISDSDSSSAGNKMGNMGNMGSMGNMGNMGGVPGGSSEHGNRSGGNYGGSRMGGSGGGEPPSGGFGGNGGN